MSIREVLSDLGGITAVARGLGHRNVSTVQGWWDRETIPARRQLEVLELARALKKPVAAEDLIPGASARRSL